MAPVLFVIATAVIALWVDVRFPGLAPTDLKGVTIHLGVAFLVSTVGSHAVSSVILVAGVPFARLIALFAVLAALGYLLLAVIWAIRLAQGPLRSLMR